MKTPDTRKQVADWPVWLQFLIMAAFGAFIAWLLFS